MSPSERLSGIAKQLEAGEAVQPVTVREFLSWFEAKRRGYWIVAQIRHELDQSRLRTEPDFEAVFIDSPISFSPVQPKKKSKGAKESKKRLGSRLLLMLLYQ